MTNTADTPHSLAKRVVCGSGSFISSTIALAKEMPLYTYIMPMPLVFMEANRVGSDGRTHLEYADAVGNELYARCLGNLPSPDFKNMPNPKWLDMMQQR